MIIFSYFIRWEFSMITEKIFVEQIQQRLYVFYLIILNIITTKNKY